MDVISTVDFIQTTIVVREKEGVEGNLSLAL